MFRCPYCGSQVAHPKPDELPLSYKRREVYNYIVAAGPRGVKKEKLIAHFFAACKSDTILRTTIFYINRVIAPQRINSKGGIIRLMINDQ